MALLNTDATQVTIADIDWATFKPLYTTLTRRLFFTNIDSKSIDPQPKTNGGNLLQELSQTSGIERQELITGYLRSQVAHTLGLVANDIDLYQSLHELGLDSLMAVELRNHIQATLNTTLPMIAFMETPNIANLVVQLDENIAPVTAGNGAQLQPNTSDWVEGEL
ncbi:MAG: hypothetical protein F6K39_44855 [Okeania sp. SIO3B3]|nr:hypothetical protein [Okeania sp. SIO3B3]